MVRLVNLYYYVCMIIWHASIKYNITYTLNVDVNFISILIYIYIVDPAYLEQVGTYEICSR